MPIDGVRNRPSLSTPCQFRFTWRGIGFAADLLDDGTDVRLRLDADLGPVPYSLENPARRQSLLAICGNRRCGQFAVGRDGHLHHYAEMPMDAAPDATALVTAVVKLLLVARPAYDQAA